MYISSAIIVPIVFRPSLELLPVCRNSVVAAQLGAAKVIGHRKIWPPSVGNLPPHAFRASACHAIQPTVMETRTVRCQVEWIGSAKSYAVVYAWMKIGEDGGRLIRDGAFFPSRSL